MRHRGIAAAVAVVVESASSNRSRRCQWSVRRSADERRQIGGLNSSLTSRVGSCRNIASPLHRHSPYRSRICYIYSTPFYSLCAIISISPF